jgi:hypothetical protein
MRPLRDLTTILGGLALVGTLALLSPGVRAVRADAGYTSDASSLAADGPTCEAGTVNGGPEIVEFLQHVQRLQIEKMAASSDSSEAGGDFIVLNNRGYNYGPAEMALPRAIELENR